MPVRSLRACAAVLSAFAALGAAAPAPSSGPAPAATAGDACFSPRGVINYSTPEISSVLVRIGKGGDVFELTFASPCPDVDWTDGFVVRGGAHEVCEGKDQDLMVIPNHTSDTGLADRCTIRDVRRLSADEVAALPGRARP